MEKKEFFFVSDYSFVLVLVFVFFFNCSNVLCLANCASLLGITQGNLRMHCNAHSCLMTNVSTPAFQPEVGIAYYKHLLFSV